MADRVEQLIERARSLDLQGLPDEQIDFFWETIDRWQPDFIAEWGTNTGSTARLLYEASVIRGLSLQVHSTDHNQTATDAEGRARGHFCLDSPVILHVGDGLEISVGEANSAQSQRPLFFIDDNKEPEETRHALYALEAIFPKAVILIHDVRPTAHGQSHEVCRFAFARTNSYALECYANMMRLVPR